MPICIGRLNGTYHDLPMPTCSKKTSMETERKSSKLQRMQNRTFEGELILNYKEPCKKHENHFISAVLFPTLLRCKKYSELSTPFCWFVGWLFTGMVASISAA